jgi:hypothetical protein
MLTVFCLTVFILAGCAAGPSWQAPQEEGRAIPAREASAEDPARFSGAAADLPLFAAAHLGPSKKPITQNGRPLAVTRKDMVVLLAVQTQDARGAAFARVSDFNRLFEAGAEEMAFSVEVFTLTADGKVTLESIDAGRHKVCGSFSELPFPGEEAFPFGVSLLFPDTEGQRSFWVIFPGGGTRQEVPRYSVFSFYEEANVRAFIQDVDENGIFDLLLFENIFEDSSGYETYITWHKWDGGSFVKYRSTNIVRRLRAFFESSRQMLLSRSWRRFFEYALLPEDSGRLQSTQAAAAFRRILRIQEGGPGENDIYTALFAQDVSNSAISEVVFPNVVENPFPPGKDWYGSFPFTIRIRGNEESYFFSARLAINKNPFSGRMFHFLPGE